MTENARAEIEKARTLALQLHTPRSPETAEACEQCGPLFRLASLLEAALDVVGAARNVSGLTIGAWPELAEVLARFDAEVNR